MTAVLACSAGLLAAGCGKQQDSSPATSTTPAPPASAARRAVTVDIASFRFVPASVAVTVGGSVTWRNRDKAPHSAENGGERGPAQFDTGRLDRSDRMTVEFARPGVYPYFCIYHRFMEATVTVR